MLRVSVPDLGGVGEDEYQAAIDVIKAVDSANAQRRLHAKKDEHPTLIGYDLNPLI